MGYQIIKQTPSEEHEQWYAIWSTSLDMVIFWDATEEEIHDFFAEKARLRFEQVHADEMQRVKEDDNPYFQFGLSWHDAVLKHEENHGPLEGVDVPTSPPVE